MNPATPNDPKPAASPAATEPAREAPKPAQPHGAPIPARFDHFTNKNSGGGSKFFSGRNARTNIPPAAMRQQRHGRHDG